MDIRSFYSSILPGQGLRVLAVFKNGLGSPPVQLFYENNDDLIEAAEAYNKLGKNVYHACATYTTDKSRKADNTEAAKALWLDLDVGPNKPYSTVKDAAAAIEAFRRAIGLPESSMVVSGSGLHIYFPLTRPISPKDWVRLATAFASCLDAAGVRHDTSRTTDVASILRIPGTNNYKTTPARAVKLIRLGVETTAPQIYKKLKEYADANGIFFLEKGRASTVPITNDLVGSKDYPPSSATRIEAQCPTIGSVASTGGDVPYEVWWRAIGVAKHTTDPVGTSISWTRNRSSTGHAKSDYQAALDGWAVGPTTCQDFAKHSKDCSTCPHNGRITSPIQLGVEETPVVAPVEPPTEPPKELEWTFGAPWLMEEESRVLGIGHSNGQLTLRSVDENQVVKHVPFCDRYWQVMRRIRSPEGVWQLEIAYTSYINPNVPFQTFLLPSMAVTSPDLLKKAFSERELHIYGGTRAMTKTQDKIIWEQSRLYNYRLDTPTHRTMGWATVNHTTRGEMTGEFIIGDQAYAPRKLPSTVLLSDQVDASFRFDFRTKGSTAEWVELVDKIYNRKGAEAYQFVIAAMFAAPLVRLVPGGGDWHGIPIALVGDSGAAKTSTALVGLSIYAPPHLLRFNANSGKDGQGDTLNALTIKIGTLANLPFLCDEMTSVEPEKISQIMYMLSNGKMKDRAHSTGVKMIENTMRWDTLSIITGNDSLHERLRELRNQNTQDATQLRCFEVKLRAQDLATVFADVHRTTVEQKLLDEQYGCVGRDWIQFLVNNRNTVSELLRKAREKFNVDADDTSATRFYKDLLVMVQVGGLLAQQRGYIKWDITKMLDWARRNFGSLKNAVFDRDWEGTISDFIASMHGRTIVTAKMSLGRGRRSNNLEMPRDPLSTTLPPVARKAVEDKVFVITANSVKDWASENRITASTLVNEMYFRGYIKNGDGEKPTTRLINIGSGTTIARPQAPCYELDYEKVANFSAGDDAADTTNVVNFPTPPVTELVTPPAADAPPASVSP